MRTSVFVLLILIPLVSYAVLATIAVIVLLLRSQSPDPLERLPDIEGQYKGARHTRQGAISYERIRPDSPVPAKLRVGLGQNLRVGDVEIHPERVALGRIRFRQQGFEPEPAEGDSLMLRFTVKNVSLDTEFSPTDPYFDRQWNTLFSSGAPYTCLEIGEHRLYGGALRWERGRSCPLQETIDGQPYRILQPGEELATLACTDPDAHVRRLLADYHGPLLWRVWLRRGFVQVGDREVSATAVVGVEFEQGDVHMSAF
jgi:hypothetical protein